MDCSRVRARNGESGQLKFDARTRRDNVQRHRGLYPDHGTRRRRYARCRSIAYCSALCFLNLTAGCLVRSETAPSSFNSATDAVNCAHELQAALVNDSELRLRIGIHVGDVVFSANNVVGKITESECRVADPCAGSPRRNLRLRTCLRRDSQQTRDGGDLPRRKERVKNPSRPIRVYILGNTASSGRGEKSAGSAFARVAHRTALRLPSLRTFSLASVGTALVGYLLYSTFYVELATAFLIYYPRMLPVRVH